MHPRPWLGMVVIKHKERMERSWGKQCRVCSPDNTVYYVRVLRFPLQFLCSGLIDEDPSCYFNTLMGDPTIPEDEDYTYGPPPNERDEYDYRRAPEPEYYPPPTPCGAPPAEGPWVSLLIICGSNMTRVIKSAVMVYGLIAQSLF